MHPRLVHIQEALELHRAIFRKNFPGVRHTVTRAPSVNGSGRIEITYFDGPDIDLVCDLMPATDGYLFSNETDSNEMRFHWLNKATGQVWLKQEPGRNGKPPVRHPCPDDSGEWEAVHFTVAGVHINHKCPPSGYWRECWATIADQFSPEVRAEMRKIISSPLTAGELPANAYFSSGMADLDEWRKALSDCRALWRNRCLRWTVAEGKESGGGGRVLGGSKSGWLRVEFMTPPGTATNRRLRMAGFEWVPAITAWESPWSEYAEKAAWAIIGPPESPQEVPVIHIIVSGGMVTEVRSSATVKVEVIDLDPAKTDPEHDSQRDQELLAASAGWPVLEVGS